MKRFVYCVAFLVATGTATAIAQTPAVTPTPAAQVATTAEAALDRLLKAPHADAAWFAPSFLAKVTTAQVDSVLASTRETLGAYKSLDKQPQGYDALYEHGLSHFLVGLDEQGRFETLIAQGPELFELALSEAMSQFGSEGQISYVVIRDGRKLIAVGQDRALAVGSTFKLAILNALKKNISLGRLHWNDVVPLREDWKSFPSGLLQDWPTGTPMTIQTLASLMVSQSDNTATDALLSIVGRDDVEKFAASNRPILSTRNMFTLKSNSHFALRRKWQTANVAVRRQLVAQMDRMPLPELDDLDMNPALNAIEWHFTNTQLCSLMSTVASLPLTQISSGVASKTDWKRVSYKGGSDGGVMSMTSDLVAKNGAHYCVSVTLNNDKAAINESAFAKTYGVLLKSIAHGTIKP